MNQPYIFNIQRFSLHDGSGIRTTVFFKGCPMRCLWCHNPEGQQFEPEIMRDKEGGESQIGTAYSVEELLSLCQKDQLFYDQSGGGVTLSGGEVMAQDMDYVEALLAGLERKGISAAIDTCGCTAQEHFERVLPWDPLFLYDVKVMDEKLHEKYTGAPLAPVLDNLCFLSRNHARVNLRLIMVKNLNMDPELPGHLLNWLRAERISLEGISLLPYHDFGRDKYGRLGRECTQNFEKPDEQELDRVKVLFEQAGYKVSIGG